MFTVVISHDKDVLLLYKFGPAIELFLCFWQRFQIQFKFYTIQSIFQYMLVRFEDDKVEFGTVRK